MAKGPEQRRGRAAKSRADREARDTRPRPAWIALSLAAVLGLQFWMCRGKLDLPFADTRLHYNFDNAEFTFEARNGLRNGDLRSQSGVTLNRYSRWGERVGAPSYYTDHPFLAKALFQQYARIAGTGESASRTFYLALSFAVAAGLFTVLLQTTGGIPAALAGAATLVSLPLFATYQTCVKFETDGMVASVWLFAALLAFLRTGTRRSLWLYGALCGVAILAHWTAGLFAAAVGSGLLILARSGRHPNAARALRATLAGGLAGGVALLGVMSYVQGGWAPARAALGRAFATRTATVSAAAWWERQGEYAKQNFGVAWPWIAIGLLLFLAVRWFRARSAAPAAFASFAAPELLGLFFVATLAVAVVWLFAFRQGSFVHIYWQLWFCLPLAVLVAAFIGSLPPGSFASLAGMVGCGALIVSLFSTAQRTYDDILHDQLGRPDDIALLTSLRDDRFDRFVFVPLTDTSLNAWFTGPLFEYYTDRSVAIAASGSDVRPGDKLLVLRFTTREDVVARVSGWARAGLVNEKCGLRLCAYDVVTPPDAKPD